MLKRDKSQTLIVVLVVVVIALGLGAAFLFYSRTAIETTETQIYNEQAYSLAKSGLERFTQCVSLNPCTCNISDQTFSLGGGTFTANFTKTLEGSTVKLDITSTGKYEKSSRILKASISFPLQEWYKYYTPMDAYASAVVKAADGGFYVAGKFVAQSGLIIIKTDSQGNREWANTYSDTGISDYQTDQIQATPEASDGGFVFAGSVAGPGGPGGDYSDLFLLKVSSAGQITWARIYATSGSEGAGGVKRTSDGGYIVTGIRVWDTLLMKVNANGDLDTTFGGTGAMAYAQGVGVGRGVLQTVDGGFVAHSSTNDTKWGLLKTTSTGILSWARRFDKCDMESQNSYLVQASDGGFVIGGTTYSPPWTPVLIKTDANGNKQWVRGYIDGAYATFQRTTDGGYIIGGFGTSTLIKTDADGHKQWARGNSLPYGSPGPSFNALGLQQLSNGGYVGCVSHWIQQDQKQYASLFTTDSSGNMRCCGIEDTTSQIGEADLTSSINQSDLTGNGTPVSFAVKKHGTDFNVIVTPLFPSAQTLCPQQ